MTAIEQKTAAKKFAEYWKDKGDEKQETSRFWIELLGNVFGVEEPTKYIEFEKPVMVEKNQKYIDSYIPSTKILIEQKSSDIKLNRTTTQSDGEKLTPYGQAFRYNSYLSYDEKAKWIIICNFTEILIYNMNNPNDEPEQILLKDLPKEFYRLKFLIDKNDNHVKKEMEVSTQAGELVGELYNALLKQYKNPDSPESLKSLNMLCVRLVFCLYAEDAGIFGKHSMFHDYLKQFDAKNARKALIELFRILDTTEDKRDPYDETMLSEFPYVNGGLFRDEEIEIPNFNDEILDLLLNKASDDFDWSEISPTIFGAVFESTLNPETRRKGGMHYTSIENIHKVIDPLFLNDLHSEFEEIMKSKQINVRKNKLYDFQDKLSKLTFLDPACGSGNFLTETYLSLRRLENNVVREIIISEKQLEGQLVFGGKAIEPIKVSIGQFYGIEINDFAVSVAKTALWIAENQMMKETEQIIEKRLDFLPLKSYANILEGNALRMDWESVVPKADLNYIMGNPPFVGARLMSAEQKDDVFTIFDGVKNNGNLDYVSCWYKKAADMMTETSIRTALVSTNSITQGEQVAILWKPLYEKGVHIDFAHRTFRWDSEASLKAHVHCVIIGFSIAPFYKAKVIYTGERPLAVEKINGYLVNADNVFIESRNKPLCDSPVFGIGNKPIDGGYYLFTEEEMNEFVKKEPLSAKWFRPWLGADEFINRYYRYCLWLGDCPPNELRKMPECMKRVEAVKNVRLSSKSAGTVKIADKPTRFHVENFPKSEYIVIPEISSEKRKYIPMGFMTPDVMCSNRVKISENATLYHFGVLTSNVHMAWVNAVCGRLETRYCYSVNIVYNNFPWCNPTEEQKAKIEKTAQMILDARAKYPDCSLADLYDELTMPPELRKAHLLNDIIVMKAYGFDRKITESECVAELMQMYVELTEGK